MRIVCRACAKINWALDILNRREDGYHEMNMLIQSIELADELAFESARFLSLSVNGKPLPTGGRNLVIRAANALNEYTGSRCGARIRLKKNIPIRAGLGGGSADCAAALLALNQLWQLHLPMDILMKIAATLGADVPFMLRGGLAQVGGIGEVIHPLDNPSRIPLVLITPPPGLSTPQVFGAFDESPVPAYGLDPAALADALRSFDLVRADAIARNSLESAAIRLLPAVGEAMDALRDHDAAMVRMSGSGSTVFGAFDSEEKAAAAAKSIPGAVLTHSALTL